MPEKKFGVTRTEVANHKPEPQIHFLKFVPKVLSIPDAAQLVMELVDAIGEDDEALEAASRAFRKPAKARR